jgi:hypothetical protein
VQLNQALAESEHAGEDTRLHGVILSMDYRDYLIASQDRKISAGR